MFWKVKHAKAVKENSLTDDPFTSMTLVWLTVMLHQPLFSKAYNMAERTNSPFIMISGFSPLEWKYSRGYFAEEFLTLEFWWLHQVRGYHLLTRRPWIARSLWFMFSSVSTTARPTNLIPCIFSFRTLGISFCHPTNSLHSHLMGGGGWVSRLLRNEHAQIHSNKSTKTTEG